jgi:hypothetical protein
MILRICDKAVTPQKTEVIKNIRIVTCSAVYDYHRDEGFLQNDNPCTFCNVVLYVNPKTRKATVVPMWLENMSEVDDD